MMDPAQLVDFHASFANLMDALLTLFRISTGFVCVAGCVLQCVLQVMDALLTLFSSASLLGSCVLQCVLQRAL